MKRTYTSIIILAALVLTIGLAFKQFILPEPLPADTAGDQFSAGRAIELLEPLVQEPHPAGSPQLAEVRAKLVSQLEELGLQVEIQSTTGTLPRYNAAGHADNILARLPGTQSSGALLLVAHYDSVPQGPGAGDNGSGVVTILESLRALQDELPLKNDILVLFTDAEEYGILGAQAFTGQHPWMDDISVVLNIEGTLQGSVVLVETGPENGWFVRNFRQTSSHALGYSWLYDLFGLMPNLTDFMPFREAGLAGGNLFAFNGGSQYHTPRDTIENMDPRSLQQHGEQTLALIRHFGEIDLGNPHSPDVVYFNILKNWMAVYPSEWALPLSSVVFLLIALSIGINIRRQQIRFRKLAWGGLASLGIIAAAILIVLLTWYLITWIHSQYNLYFPAHTYNDGWYAAGFSFLAAAVAVGFSILLLRKQGWRNLLGGALVLLGAIGVIISVYLPGFSYLFTWPLVFALLPLWMQSPDAEKLSFASSMGLGLLPIVSVLLWLPVGAVLYWSTGLDFLPAMTLAVVLPFLLAAPQIAVLTRSRQWLVPGALAAITVICLIGGSLTSGFNADHPLPLRVQYFLNADSGEAYWINSPGYISEWQSQFTQNGKEEISWSELFPPFKSTIVCSPAPIAALSEPNVTILDDFIKGTTRHLLIRVTPTRQSDQLILAFPPEVAIFSAMVEEQPWMENPAGNTSSSDEWQVLFFAAPPDNGIEILLATALPEPEMFLVAERSVGIDSLPGVDFEPRPESILSLGDYVYVSQTIYLKNTNQ